MCTAAADSPPWAQAPAPFPESFGGSSKELSRQRQNVLAPFAQWRYRDLDNPEAIIQILTKPRGVHIREEITIGGREDTRVDCPRPVLTDAAHLAFLQHPEQFHLHGRRHIADLVEQKRAAVGSLEETWAILRSACK